MHKRYLLLLFLMACQSKPLDPPKIQKTQLVPIIGELRILESAYALRYQQMDSSSISIASYQEEIFKRYQIQREAVTQSVQYYASQPDSMKALDSLVLIWLEEKSKTLQP